MLNVLYTHNINIECERLKEHVVFVYSIISCGWSSSAPGPALYNVCIFSGHKLTEVSFYSIKVVFVYFLAGLKCIGHLFAHVAHL
jgi:hypothetical protein